MKIKVVKSKLPSYWYSKHIGEIFDVEKSKDGDYDLI